jgi:hypothetical protein
MYKLLVTEDRTFMIEESVLFSYTYFFKLVNIALSGWINLAGYVT